MPTLVNTDGYRVMIYTEDHGPAHVHVLARGCQAAVLLNCPNGPPELRDFDGFNHRELRAVYNIVNGNLNLLCEAWEGYHVHR